MKYLSPPELKQLCVLMKLYCNCNQQELTGLKDTNFKLWACYLATKATNLSLGQIANYFNIYPKFLRGQLENMALEYMLDSSATPKILDAIEDAYKELESVRSDA